MSHQLGGMGEMGTGRNGDIYDKFCQAEKRRFPYTSKKLPNSCPRILRSLAQAEAEVENNCSENRPLLFARRSGIFKDHVYFFLNLLFDRSMFFNSLQECEFEPGNYHSPKTSSYECHFAEPSRTTFVEHPALLHQKLDGLGSSLHSHLPPAALKTANIG